MEKAQVNTQSKALKLNRFPTVYKAADLLSVPQLYLINAVTYSHNIVLGSTDYNDYEEWKNV